MRSPKLKDCSFRRKNNAGLHVQSHAVSLKWATVCWHACHINLNVIVCQLVPAAPKWPKSHCYCRFKYFHYKEEHIVCCSPTTFFPSFCLYVYLSFLCFISWSKRINITKTGNSITKLSPAPPQLSIRFILYYSWCTYIQDLTFSVITATFSTFWSIKLL